MADNTDTTDDGEPMQEVVVQAKATPVPSVLQYIRKCQIILADSAGNGLDFSLFKVTFQIRRGDNQTPNSCRLRIYNLAASTINEIQGEFSQIRIAAGYDGNMGLIFTGTIVQKRFGQVDGKDSYVDIMAADGDKAYNFSAISHALKSGAMPTDEVQAFLKYMGSFGITQGYQPQFSSSGLPRGRVFYGSVTDELTDFANANDCTWSIQDGALTLIPLNSYIPSGTVPIISPQTGLVGVPEQTQNGINMRVLLNPTLKIGQRVQLQQSVVTQTEMDITLTKEALIGNYNLKKSAKVSGDGMYYVMWAEHTGDTRGEDWYTDLVCLAVDATIPQGDVSKSNVLPGFAVIAQN